MPIVNVLLRCSATSEATEIIGQELRIIVAEELSDETEPLRPSDVSVWAQGPQQSDGGEIPRMGLQILVLANDTSPRHANLNDRRDRIIARARAIEASARLRGYIAIHLGHCSFGFLPDPPPPPEK